MIYLDNAATSQPLPEVVLEVLKYQTELWGNPSSIYDLGSETKRALERAKIIIATSINAEPDEIYFTSGGTESDNWALISTARQMKEHGKNHIITTCIEHHAVLNTCKWLETQGFEITYLPVDANGYVNPKDIKNAINKRTGLISVMMANNEIGTIQPIDRIADMVCDHNLIFHTDAVQAYCHTEIDVDLMGIDLLSVSAHKFHGPKGVGFLYINNFINKEPLLFGGQQQFGMRPGTENVPGIMGMAKAVELSKYSDSEMTKLWYLFKTELFDVIPNIHLNGGITRLANNLNVRFDGIQGEVLLAMLNERGICASSGSACTSESGEPSHVLKAIGLTDEEARSSLRFTMSEFTTKEEIYEAVKIIKDCVERLREVSITHD